ncbi:PTS mannitol transporter subunit IIA [Alicyclobacillus contaminans]|uniref:PTS sugar transporter subunit IIA n=1 Tax=Alicyclobacillus contaminans TaxID=392016 RepID=UPI000428ABB7|nr:PTS sugar transporter subunit IIA [Alicyclobacillus contaminans]GMA51499.1 PTS mannitol transporter subunit IIA [Alicyclobacillus contaminans]
MQLLRESDILYNNPSESKDDAIRRVGGQLVANGYVEAPYIEGMLAREASMTTYIGNGVAIPHSLPEYVQHIRKSGIILAQYPEGVDFGDGNTAYLVIGIAGKQDEHLGILSQIAIVCQDEDNVKKLVAAKSYAEIAAVLAEGEV